MKVELQSLKQRADDLAYLMIEAEGKKYFTYAQELAHVEYEIDQKEQEINNTSLLRSSK